MKSQKGSQELTGTLINELRNQLQLVLNFDLKDFFSG